MVSYHKGEMAVAERANTGLGPVTIPPVSLGTSSERMLKQTPATSMADYDDNSHYVLHFSTQN